MIGWISLHAIGSAGELKVNRDEHTQTTTYRLSQGETAIEVAPEAGANVFSLQVSGVEYFRRPNDLRQLPGVGYGNPILYPMPNRVRGAEFTFDGQQYPFPANAGKNFIHGLVHSRAWKVAQIESKRDSVSLAMTLDFEPGTELYKLFPFEHRLQVTVRVHSNGVRWTYFVINTGERPVPFGFAFHPYFVYQGNRRDTYLKVPATHLMEATDQLPSGELLELDQHPLDAREPKSLEGFRADDVYFGMQTGQPAEVEFRDRGRRVTFRASEEFTHLVVYTPDQPFFCIENQTCATDAHNLHAAGKQAAAHLQLCAPGETKSGWVEYQIETTAR